MEAREEEVPNTARETEEYLKHLKEVLLFLSGKKIKRIAACWYLIRSSHCRNTR